jgi:predicted amidohydrolase
MATTGYCFASRTEIAPLVEPIPGPTTARFAEIAREHGCWIVVGMPEVQPQTGIFYNSAALIGPDGVAGVYRKTHPYKAEPKWAKDGDLGLPVFETPLGRIAIQICMDFCFPEPTRIQALRGADVICFPTNWVGSKCPSATWMARALEGGVYVVAADRYGCERGVQFCGGSCILDPDGGVQAALDSGDGIVYGEVDPARARDKRFAAKLGDRLDDRRPAVYGNLTLNTYLWRDWDFHGAYGIRPLPPGRHSRVAVAQWTPAPHDPEANLCTIERLASQHAGADLLVLPELALTGAVNADEAERLAEPVPGPRTERLRQIAAAHTLYLVAGLVERDGDALFSTAVLVGPHGLAGRYRKVHLTEEDRAWATPGSELPAFDIPLGRIGILIGYDALFPEAARCLALDGADLLACPAKLGFPPVRGAGATAVPLPPPIETGPATCHFHLWRERALENCAYVAFANWAAPEMGWSAIVGPDPEGKPHELALIEGEHPGSVELPVDTTGFPTRYQTNIVRAKDYLGWRMPIWYDPLQAPAVVDERDTIRAVPVAGEPPRSVRKL